MYLVDKLQTWVYRLRWGLVTDGKEGPGLGILGRRPSVRALVRDGSGLARTCSLVHVVKKLCFTYLPLPARTRWTCHGFCILPPPGL